MCGQEVEDNVLICPICGSYVDRNKKVGEEESKPESNYVPEQESAAPRVFAILCLVFGLLGGLAAFVMGILGFIFDKKRKYTTYYVVGMLIALFWLVILIILVAGGYLDLTKSFI